VENRFSLLVSVPLLAGLALFVLSGCAAQPPAAPTQAPVKPAATERPAATATTAPAVATAPPGATATTAPPATATVAAAAAAAPSATEGKTRYTASCASCHGEDAAGGKKIGDVIAADIREPALEEAFKGDNALIGRAILDGKDEEGNDLSPAMPRFKGKLTDQQVDDIIAYLKTLK